MTPGNTGDPMAFKLVELLAWWTGNTLGTRFTLWRAKAAKVGTDELGNTYWRAPELYKGQGERRWVTYAGDADGSKVPPGWHAWMCHVTDTPPSEESYKPREWQKPHRPNMTGTAQAYRPAGSILAGAERPAATGDYQAWTPRS
jgi:NADH:ubiquinone oxidoreductase subunit